MAYWEEELLPSIQRGEKALVVAHANSLRSLIKRLDGLGEEGVGEGGREGGVSSRMAARRERVVGEEGASFIAWTARVRRWRQRGRRESLNRAEEGGEEEEDGGEGGAAKTSAAPPGAEVLLLLLLLLLLGVCNAFTSTVRTTCSSVCDDNIPNRRGANKGCAGKGGHTKGLGSFIPPSLPPFPPSFVPLWGVGRISDACWWAWLVIWKKAGSYSLHASSFKTKRSGSRSLASLRTATADKMDSSSDSGIASEPSEN
jgi:hypothetical protein